LDAFHLGDLLDTGKPLGMIADFYIKNFNNGETEGVEVEPETLRFSGPLSMNTPLEFNKHACVSQFPLNFWAELDPFFDRRIGSCRQIKRNALETEPATIGASEHGFQASS